jgi:hypothetical protein
VPPVSGRPAPYDDVLDEDGVLRYRYRGDDPQHRDNVGLRLAMQRGVPLIYLFGTVPGWYAPVWPVLVVNDDLVPRHAEGAGLDCAGMPVSGGPTGEQEVPRGIDR